MSLLNTNSSRLTMPALIFPSPGMQVLSAFIYFAGISVISHCVSGRLASEEVLSWNTLKQTTWARLCILLIFLDSWAFLFSSGIVTFGVGLSTNATTCAFGIYICLFFYGTSKLLIYCFLIEKVHVVWSPTASSKRRHSKIYMIAATVVGAYVAVVCSMIIGRVTFLREHDQACIIGVKRYASIILLTYDAFVNVFLTSLFLYPLIRRNMTPQIRNVALRTLIAACVALTTSTANIIVLTLMKGHQLGWVCLLSCASDVVFNGLAILWVTLSSDVRAQVPTSEQELVRQTIDLDISAANASSDRPVVTSQKSGGTEFSSSICNSMYDFPFQTPSKVYFGSLGPPSQFEESICSYKLQHPESILRVMTQGVTRPISEVHELQVAVENEDEIQEVERGVGTGVRSSVIIEPEVRLPQDVHNERASR
ncbi:hypothetical protein BDZ89DRAFT_981468 [Hymenopellis radicata]|nr:hypothetical protein BDZ89DRAFT_981468 [Hymenopellis radicata]